MLNWRRIHNSWREYQARIKEKLRLFWYETRIRGHRLSQKLRFRWNRLFNRDTVHKSARALTQPVRKLPRKKREWNQKVNEIKNKGHQRLTIMIIPHGEKRIFNFHISLFMVGFAFMILLTVFTVSLFEAVNSGSEETEKEKLSEIDSRNNNEILNFQQAREAILEVGEDVNENHQKILNLLQTGDEELIPFEEVEALEELVRARVVSEESDDGFRYISEIFEFRTLYAQLRREMMALETLTRFINRRAEIRDNSPFAWPIFGGRLTSGYGLRFDPFGKGNIERHTGLDFGAAYGSPIYAPADGKVIRAVWSNGRTGYGTHLVIRHKYGFHTLYGHCSQLLVSMGENVQKGQKIALVGSTGRSTGPHLHYEVRLGSNQKPQDPRRYLPGL